jgi:hypothetical protein
MTMPAFDDLLSQIEDRSAALRAAAAGTPAQARVPGCPDWSLHDLIAHLGGVQRFWAAVVQAGPADGPPDDVPGSEPQGDLLAWSAESAAVIDAGYATRDDVVEFEGRKFWRTLAAIRHPDDPYHPDRGSGLGHRTLFQLVAERPPQTGPAARLTAAARVGHR